LNAFEKAGAEIQAIVPKNTMRIVVLLLMAVGISRADTATLAGQYTRWKYAAEIQVRNPGIFDCPREVVDVGLRLPASRTANLENDARVVLKNGFSELVREIPFQIYGIKTQGDFTTCRVAFYTDIPANGFQRFAVFYDNPAAARAVFASRVKVKRSSEELSVETPFYAVAFGASTAQCLRLKTNVPKPQALYAGPGAGRPGSPFPLPAVCVPAQATEKYRPLTLAWAEVPRASDDLLEGPVFSAVRGQRRLLDANGGVLASVGFTYLFYAEAPHFVVQTTLTFLRDSAVYSVESDTLGGDQAVLTHYMFRPVSPTFPLTEVEEVGSVLVDAATRGGFSDGDLLAGMLPGSLAWQALANIDKGFTVTAFDFFSHDSSPDGCVPYYRPSTRARLRQGWVECSRAPIYVTARDGPTNTIKVRAGTVFGEAQAVYFSGFDTGDWRTKTDGYGRQLNTKMDIKVYPRGTGLPDDDHAYPHHGERGDAYLRGIR
jgi:hypothetical protein